MQAQTNSNEIKRKSMVVATQSIDTFCDGVYERIIKNVKKFCTKNAEELKTEDFWESENESAARFLAKIKTEIDTLKTLPQLVELIGNAIDGEKKEKPTKKKGKAKASVEEKKEKKQEKKALLAQHPDRPKGLTSAYMICMSKYRADFQKQKKITDFKEAKTKLWDWLNTTSEGKELLEEATKEADENRRLIKEYDLENGLAVAKVNANPKRKSPRAYFLSEPIAIEEAIEHLTSENIARSKKNIQGVLVDWWNNMTKEEKSYFAEKAHGLISPLGLYIDDRLKSDEFSDFHRHVGRCISDWEENEDNVQRAYINAAKEHLEVPSSPVTKSKKRSSLTGLDSKRENHVKRMSFDSKMKKTNDDEDDKPVTKLPLFLTDVKKKPVEVKTKKTDVKTAEVEVKTKKTADVKAKKAVEVKKAVAKKVVKKTVESEDEDESEDESVSVYSESDEE